MYGNIVDDNADGDADFSGLVGIRFQCLIVTYEQFLLYCLSASNYATLSPKQCLTQKSYEIHTSTFPLMDYINHSSITSTSTSTGVEDGFTPDPTLFYGSTHEKDNFPMTGVDPTPWIGDRARHPVNRRIVNRTLPRGPISVPVFREKWYVPVYFIRILNKKIKDTNCHYYL